MFGLIILSVIISGYSNILLNNTISENYNNLQIAYNNFLDNKQISTNNIKFIEHTNE
jgi:hypothetical protein